MRKLICTIIIFFIYSTAHAIEEDKKMHMIGSAAISGLTLMAVDLAKPEWPSWKKWLVSGSIAMIPGIAKELHDDKFDWQDIAADAVGAYGGNAMVISITIRW